MSPIQKIRKALATMPQTKYSDGLGSNTKVWYDKTTKEYVAAKHRGTVEYIFKAICRRVEEEQVKAIEAIFELSYCE